MPMYTVGANRVISGYFVVEADDPQHAEEIAEERKDELEHNIISDSIYTTFATPGDTV